VEGYSNVDNMQVMLVTCRPAFSGALKSWCLGSRECRHMSLSEESWHICYSAGGGPMLISSWLMAHGSWLMVCCDAVWMRDADVDVLADDQRMSLGASR
jgi:hypothetical protein